MSWECENIWNMNHHVWDLINICAIIEIQPFMMNRFNIWKFTIHISLGNHRQFWLDICIKAIWDHFRIACHTYWRLSHSLEKHQRVNGENIIPFCWIEQFWQITKQYIYIYIYTYVHDNRYISYIHIYVYIYHTIAYHTILYHTFSILLLYIPLYLHVCVCQNLQL